MIDRIALYLSMIVAPLSVVGRCPTPRNDRRSLDFAGGADSQPDRIYRLFHPAPRRLCSLLAVRTRSRDRPDLLLLLRTQARPRYCLPATRRVKASALVKNI